ncbi:MAG TPA: hypothetical protein VF188_02435 [Longimicrobiales bacterium]
MARTGPEPPAGRSPRRYGRPEALLARRRARIVRITGRELAGSAACTLPAARAAHLCDGAVELYWNELAWEQITAEEAVGGSQRVERMFPGFLAMIDGLLQHHAEAAWAPPRADVVDQLLLFLAGRCVDLACAAAREVETRSERELTLRLLDLVLYRRYALGPEEVERLEIARLGGDE